MLSTGSCWTFLLVQVSLALGPCPPAVAAWGEWGGVTVANPQPHKHSPEMQERDVWGLWLSKQNIVRLG